MITYIEKDNVLKKIVDESIDMQYSFNVFNSNELFGLNRVETTELFNYFEREGLIEYDGSLGGGFDVLIKIDAHDLINHGGFTAREEYFSKSIQKLLLEIESLKPSLPDKVEVITNIVSGISAGLGLFLTK